MLNQRIGSRAATTIALNNIYTTLKTIPEIISVNHLTELLPDGNALKYDKNLILEPDTAVMGQNLQNG